MKKMFLIAMVFGFAATVCAQNCGAAATAAQPVEVKKAEAKKEPAEKKVEKKAEKKKEKIITIKKGTVISVDAAANTVVVGFEKAKKEVQETIVVDAKTKIKKAKEVLTLSGLAVGEKVIAKYVIVDGKKVAKSITIPVKKEAPAKKAAEKK